MTMPADIHANEKAYKEMFGRWPEMPHRMPMSELNELIKEALASGKPIDMSFDPEELT